MDKAMIEASMTPDAIVTGVLTNVDEERVAQLKPSRVAVTCPLLHYGKGERNPLDEVTFYSKKKPQRCAVLGLSSSFGSTTLTLLSVMRFKAVGS